MVLRFKLELVVVADDEQVSADDIIVLNKDYERLEHVGLTVAEAAAAPRRGAQEPGPPA